MRHSREQLWLFPRPAFSSSFVSSLRIVFRFRSLTSYFREETEPLIFMPAPAAPLGVCRIGSAQHADTVSLILASQNLSGASSQSKSSNSSLAPCSIRESHPRSSSAVYNVPASCCDRKITHPPRTLLPPLTIAPPPNIPTGRRRKGIYLEVRAMKMRRGYIFLLSLCVCSLLYPYSL